MSTQDPSRVNTTSGIASPPAVPTPGHDGLDALVALIFRELRSMAHRHLVRDADHATLQTTKLVHEAYLRLVGHPEVAGRGRAYFFASAARAMRQWVPSNRLVGCVSPEVIVVRVPSLAILTIEPGPLRNGALEYCNT